MAGKLGGGLEGGEDPAVRLLVSIQTRTAVDRLYLQISRSSVEVKVDSGGSNSDRAEVGRVVVIAGVGGV